MTNKSKVEELLEQYRTNSANNNDSADLYISDGKKVIRLSEERALSRGKRDNRHEMYLFTGRFRISFPEGGSKPPF